MPIVQNEWWQKAHLDGSWSVSPGFIEMSVCENGSHFSLRQEQNCLIWLWGQSILGHIIEDFHLDDLEYPACLPGWFGTSASLGNQETTAPEGAAKDGRCVGLTICLPPPYGCSCAAGFTHPDVLGPTCTQGPILQVPIFTPSNEVTQPPENRCHRPVLPFHQLVHQLSCGSDNTKIPQIHHENTKIPQIHHETLDVAHYSVSKLLPSCIYNVCIVASSHGLSSPGCP
ncbi:hypothetical protein O3P69_015609 [Scylla paramamosain]|uniref:Uncharacterized protein n=1 Tax=Scylla paramamosain TaxID=85552 RepID=A0AAW0SA95_SCYPA